jgi:hypothetical protein
MHTSPDVSLNEHRQRQRGLLYAVGAPQLLHDGFGNQQLRDRQLQHGRVGAAIAGEAWRQWSPQWGAVLQKAGVGVLARHRCRDLGKRAAWRPARSWAWPAHDRPQGYAASSRAAPGHAGRAHTGFWGFGNSSRARQHSGFGPYRPRFAGCARGQAARWVFAPALAPHSASRCPQRLRRGTRGAAPRYASIATQAPGGCGQRCLPALASTRRRAGGSLLGGEGLSPVSWSLGACPGVGGLSGPSPRALPEALPRPYLGPSGPPAAALLLGHWRPACGQRPQYGGLPHTLLEALLQQAADVPARRLQSCKDLRQWGGWEVARRGGGGAHTSAGVARETAHGQATADTAPSCSSAAVLHPTQCGHHSVRQRAVLHPAQCGHHSMQQRNAQGSMCAECMLQSCPCAPNPP